MNQTVDKDLDLKTREATPDAPQASGVPGAAQGAAQDPAQDPAHKPTVVPREAKPFPWDKFQRNMGYTDEQMAEFKADPRRRKAAEVLAEANRRTVVARVVASHGCAAGYQIGDTIEVSAAGLIKGGTRPNCIYAVAPMTLHAVMAHDRIADGRDPGEMWWNAFSCQDSGFCAGGWGQVSFKIEVV